MKILEGSFQCEANTFCGQRAGIEDFERYEGEEIGRASCRERV